MHITIDAAQVAAVVGALFGAAATTVALLGKIRSVTKPLRDMIDRAELFWSDWAGVEDRPGVPGRSGVMLRLAGIEARQAAVEQELRTNGGASLRDAVKRTEASVADIQRQMTGATLIALPRADPNTTKGGAT